MLTHTLQPTSVKITENKYDRGKETKDCSMTTLQGQETKDIRESYWVSETKAGAEVLVSQLRKP